MVVLANTLNFTQHLLTSFGLLHVTTPINYAHIFVLYIFLVNISKQAHKRLSIVRVGTEDFVVIMVL